MAGTQITPGDSMILVTGGAGFIGSNLVAALCERGRRVAVCDRLRSDDKWRNLAKSDFSELIEPEALPAWLDSHQRLDAVVHLGAISSTTERDADLVFDVNVRLSTRIWNWCAAHRTPLLYASSAATYGAGEHGFDDDERPEALARLRPLNAYGWSKHFFDRRVVNAVAAGGSTPPQWIGLKFFNVYGPNEYHKGTMQSVVSQKYPLVAGDRPVTLFTSHDPRYPDGGQMRDFIFVEDCVDVMLWLLGQPRVNGLFNLGSGRARSFADLARAIAAAAGVAPRIEFIPMPEALRPNYQYFTEASMEKLRQAGYERPFTSVEDGVRRYVQHYLATSDRYR
jgi:ADP-L-glycero-D-manno-heptose 6-epimerase